MELVGIELLHGLLVSSKLIEQGDLLEHEVVTTQNQIRISLQEVEPFLIRMMQTLVELVEFHEHTGVRLVETEGFFHIFQRLFLTILLVETGKGEVAPYRWERRVESGRKFPVLDGHVILPFVVVETTQIIGCFGTIGQALLSGGESQHIFQTVGEAVVRYGGFRLLETKLRLIQLTQHRFGKTDIIIGHRMVLGIVHLEHVETFLP